MNILLKCKANLFKYKTFPISNSTINNLHQKKAEGNNAGENELEFSLNFFSFTKTSKNVI